MNAKITSNIGLDLVRATEAAALAAGRWMGLGKPVEADKAVTTALLAALNTVEVLEEKSAINWKLSLWRPELELDQVPVSILYLTLSTVSSS
jgi:hypothetical protein